MTWVLKFQPSGPGIRADSGVIYASRVVSVTPAVSTGEWEADLELTTLLSPEVWYEVEIEWLDDAGNFISRDRLPGRLFGRSLVDSQERRQLVHRNVGQDLVYSTHRSAFLPAAHGSAQWNRVVPATLLRARRQSPGAGTGLDWATHRSPIRRPARSNWRRLLLARACELGGQNGHHCRELFFGR